jgi:CheY-like chemotaxis protein
MRNATDLAVIFFVAQLPIAGFILASLGSNANPHWLIFAFLASVAISLFGLHRLYKHYIHPMHQYRLHLNSGESMGETSINETKPHPNLKSLQLAIRAHTTTISADLEHKAQRLQALLEEHLLKEQVTKNRLGVDKKLNPDNQRIDPQTAHLRQQFELRQSLIAPLLMEFTGALNQLDKETGSSNRLKLIASNIELLLRTPGRTGTVATQNILNLIDQTLAILRPLLDSTQCQFHVLTQGVIYFELDADGFREILLQLMLNHLQSDIPGAVTIQLSHTESEISLSFSSPFNPDINHDSTHLFDQHDARWANNTLSISATLARQPTPLDSGLTAAILCDDESERSSLTQRLNLLGVHCTNDFKSDQLDLCVIADEQSAAFIAIQPYLPESIYVLLINNTALYQRPYWIQVDDPINMIELARLIAMIRAGREKPGVKQVLAVDDSQVNLRFLTMQLTELDHLVTVAHSGYEALKLVETCHFDLVFMDVQMPDLDGVETTRRIRGNGHDVPIIALTAHATAQEKDSYFTAGMNDVLIKPVRMENLRSIIRRIDRGSARPPIAVGREQQVPIFDLELALANANQKPELAAELLSLLIDSLPADQTAINTVTNDLVALSKQVHKLHGAVLYCGVPRLTAAIEKLETTIKQEDSQHLPLLLNLLNGEITALVSWYQNNPDVLHHSSTGTD